jgi:hypothetical protein
MSDPVPADLPDQPTEHLDDPIGDRLRDTRSVFQLVAAEAPGLGFEVDKEDV